MKHAIIAALALALAGCTFPGSLPGSPAVLADQTELDEQAGLAVELAFQGATLAVTTAARADLIPADQRPRVSAAQQDAYDAVLRVRAAYDAGNAATYQPALIEARRLIANVLTLVR